MSLRRLLLAVTLLAAIACVAALATVAWVLRTSDTQRRERAREIVSRELDRLRDSDELLEFARGPRSLSGYLDDDLTPTDRDHWTPAPIRMARAAVATECRSTHASVIREFAQPRGVRRALRGLPSAPPGPPGMLVMGVTPMRRGGGFAWAATWIPEPPGSPFWRVGLLVLAFSTLGLVVLVALTLRRVERGTATLNDTLVSLKRDLAAPIVRPTLAELAVVSDGIASLADALTLSQRSERHLQTELAQRERMASLGRVAAGIAHEVRNPLASIKLRVDLAEQSLRPHPELSLVAEDLTEMGQEILRLDRLVADLLVVSGRRAGPKSDCDVGALVRRRVALLGHMADARGVRVEVQGEGRWSIDADSVTRAVDNLLRNAIEASPEGGSVRVAIERAEVLRVVVEDGGEGVPRAREAELFEPFFTTKPEGTGLGLALSRAVAMAHGGGLTYQRDEATTRFTLTLGATEG